MIWLHFENFAYSIFLVRYAEVNVLALQLKLIIFFLFTDKSDILCSWFHICLMNKLIHLFLAWHILRYPRLTFILFDVDEYDKTRKPRLDFVCLIVCAGHVTAPKKKMGKCKRDKGCIKTICIDAAEFWINNHWWKDPPCKILVKDVIMLPILIEISKSDMFLVKHQYI